MALSYSAIKAFNTCPRQYEAVRIRKLYPSQDTVHTIWGKQVHEAAEHYIRDGKQMEFDFPGQDVVFALARRRGDKYCELELAVNDKLESVPFDSPDALLRGIADLVILSGGEARVLDYKTGSAKYPDTDQLQLMALMVFAKHPEIEKVRGALLFLAHNTIVQAITKREDSARLWALWLGKIHRIEEAHRLGVWPAKPSGLCRKWCPVTTCEHCG